MRHFLTSNATFSAAEYFAVCLQSTSRAQVVGEATGGGGNSGDVVSIADGFSVFVPTGTIEAAATHKGWEGVGVIPNVPTTSAKALLTAYALALKEIDTASLTDRERKTVTLSLADPEGTLKAAVKY